MMTKRYFMIPKVPVAGDILNRLTEEEWSFDPGKTLIAGFGFRPHRIVFNAPIKLTT